jgi:hypothetical protein
MGEKMETDRLIRELAQGSGQVLRLSPPWTRTAMWFGLAVPYLVFVVIMMSPRTDLAAKLVEPTYLIEQFAALLTAIAAGFAAFASTVPGFDRRYLLLPALPFGLWFGSLSLGCLRTWLHYGPEGLSLHPDWLCFPAIVIVGMVPAIAMAVMLRRGAPLNPRLTTAFGGLAAAGLGDFGLRFFHPQDASVMVLVWQMSTVFLLTVLAGWVGALLMDWSALTERVKQRVGLH